MRNFLIFAASLLLSGSAALAQANTTVFSIGSDYFIAGDAPSHTATGADDLFMAGQTVHLQSAITGSAHMAGQYLTIESEVGGDVYAAGQDITLDATVAGDASLAGATIILSAPLSGDLRAAASKLILDAPVSGYALLAGESATLNSVITGDASLAFQDLVFGTDARIDGTLTVYEETPGDMQIPASVIPESRVIRKEIEMAEFEGMPRMFSWRDAVWSFVKGVIVVAFLAAVIAAVAPQRLATLRKQILGAPFRSLWIGFLAQSALLGATVLLIMTVIGIPLVPAVIILALVGGFIGYVIAAYALGVGILIGAGQGAPDSFGPRALAGGVGAIAAALIALIPFLGWLFVLAAVLAGIGALTQHLFRPAFFTRPDA